MLRGVEGFLFRGARIDVKLMRRVKFDVWKG